jgi:hypothetical protein
MFLVNRLKGFLAWLDILLCKHIPYWRVRVWYQQLWMRKDEFHISYDHDIRAIHKMPYRCLDAYRQKVFLRREAAHKRDLELTGT